VIAKHPKGERTRKGGQHAQATAGLADPIEAAAGLSGNRKYGPSDNPDSEHCTRLMPTALDSVCCSVVAINYQARRPYAGHRPAQAVGVRKQAAEQHNADHDRLESWA